jgi:hypothetical protein
MLPVALYGFGTLAAILKKEGRMRVLENMALRRIFGPKRGDRGMAEIAH